MTDNTINFNYETHKKLMENVLNQLEDKPLVLKGGTALMFGYGSDRFSEDLDFDLSEKFKGKKINLDSSLKKIPYDADYKIVSVESRKDTETSAKYFIGYTTPESENVEILKLDVSYRNHVDEKNIVIKGNVKYASIEEITKFKISSVLDTDYGSRTAARDLYDAAFIVENHPEAMSDAQLEQLNKLNLADVESRYREAFERDILLSVTSSSDVCLRLGLAAENEIEVRQSN